MPADAAGYKTRLSLIDDIRTFFGSPAGVNPVTAAAQPADPAPARTPALPDRQTSNRIIF